MIQRDIASKLKELAGKFPAISLTGPRQSGKTTLLKHLFNDKPYVSLEDLDTRLMAESDPRSFLGAYANGAIIDEAQRVPSLFPYLQGVLDKHDKPGLFILSGSQNFLLMESITQSLAGRVAVLKLLPFNKNELKETIFGDLTTDKSIFTGWYPRIFDKQISPPDYYASYLQTYVERDVRQLRNIQDLSLFNRFIRLCAARIGQLLNLSSLSNDCGISVTTAQTWLSLLQTSYLVYLLPPHHENFSKRLVKMPKLYFYDTGLACHLLNINESKLLSTHYLRGNLFENMIVMDIVKDYANRGLEAPVYFWRDKTGNEIDCLIDTALGYQLIEIKSAKTFNKDFLKNLLYYQKLNAGKHRLGLICVYDGEPEFQFQEVKIMPWSKATINRQ